ncbi:MAG TPA: signal peptidase II [Persephonella sp.]|uniref:Lipoprotein signal peptidase n=1 Tax=Persephonella marina (strain DSM 14350 / EX-H1) TaxID=123214 RepID=C0QRJ3_PERMH|nr:MULTISPECIES: signal peptidase II [Persephonella]ACO04425.1 signal peptidase II [Persephonella marina EX-H1]HCB69034.1 signal peptidase II [Persephonella sp.]
MERYYKFLATVFFIIAADLITKYIAVKYLFHGSITVIPGFFDLTLVWNRGAAFGILAEAPEAVRILILIIASTVAAILTMIYAYIKRSQLSNWEFYSLSLIAGGAIGNLYDRIFIGSVRDFIDIYIKDYHWPAFNIADASISLGIAGFIFYEIFLKNRKKEVQID